MNLSKLKVLKIGGHYKVKPFDRLIEEYRPQDDGWNANCHLWLQ